MPLLDRVVGRTSEDLKEIPSECKTSSRMQQQSDPVSRVADVMWLFWENGWKMRILFAKGICGVFD
jgi:hypothetical protein